MKKHEVFSVFLIGIFLIIIVLNFITSLASEDVDDVCDDENSTLFKFPNGWGCIHYANKTHLSNFTNDLGYLNQTANYSNYSNYSNTSYYWDSLNTPSDINTGDLTDDDTYATVSGDAFDGLVDFMSLVTFFGTVNVFNDLLVTGVNKNIDMTGGGWVRVNNNVAFSGEKAASGLRVQLLRIDSNDVTQIGDTTDSDVISISKGNVNMSNNLNVSENVIASSFFGDGSQLTGIPINHTHNQDLNTSSNPIFNNITTGLHYFPIGQYSIVPSDTAGIVGDLTFDGKTALHRFVFENEVLFNGGIDLQGNDIIDVNDIHSDDWSNVTVTESQVSDLNKTNPPMVRVYGNVSQSIINAVTKSVNFSTSSFDNSDFFDVERSNESIMIPEDGVYHLLFHVQWDSNAVGKRHSTIFVNDVTASSCTESAEDSWVFGGVQFDCSLFHSFSKYDNVSVSVLQLSGGTRLLSSANSWGTNLWAYKVGEI